MAESQDRVRRHREIRRLVRAEALGSQTELARALERVGHPVTQATLSRDLKELRILRVPGEGGYRYAEAPEDGASHAAAAGAEARRLHSVASLEVTGIDSNESCVVVRTLTGRAQGVAVWIDGLGLRDMLATVAGDDTILVVPRSVRKTARLKAELASVFGL